LSDTLGPLSARVLGDGWLDMRDSPLVLRHAPNLNSALDAGPD